MAATELFGDDEARITVTEDLGRTIFLEAGAGSGKTSCLVDRFVALVKSGEAADQIAAITFTEKAAAELVDRIRSALQREAPANVRCEAALPMLDSAAIGTLHAFAQRVLTEHPIEAGLPPRFRVNDEIASHISFDVRWEQYLDDLLCDSGLEPSVRLMLAAGGKLRQLRDVAVAFNANWDLVAERVTTAPVLSPPPVDVGEILTLAQEVIGFAEHCTSADDKLLLHLQSCITEFEARLRSASTDEDRLALVHNAKLKFANGQKSNWASIGKDVVLQRLEDLQQACDDVCKQVLDAVLQVLADALAAFTISGAAARRQAGELEFHDLLVLARSALRDEEHGPGVRGRLAQRYRRLLLDEFQDTDPIQIELVVLIASDDPLAGQKDWWEIPIAPGHLFFVGDPKQSIYRFRRADIRTFFHARDQLVGASSQLTTNFRTGAAILGWVNFTFAKVIIEKKHSQPRYVPLSPDRDDAEIGPPVAFFGQEHDAKTTADRLRTAEADDVATVVMRAMGEQWSVADRAPAGTEHWRPARWSDIAVLLPARTSLQALENALERADIPYRAETSSLVYGTREIRDLMLIARAVDDPTDSLAVVSALRTPGFGCGDDDLLTWRSGHGGYWDHQSRLPPTAPPDHPVAVGLTWLRDLHNERSWLSPSAVMERILRERRFFELGAAERRPRDLWRRLRFVLDQCRAWEEAGGNTFRDYLRWVQGQSAEGSRVIETVLPESDDNAVRILTIHGAKGLEFPIVILSGLTTAMRRPSRGVEVRFPRSRKWVIKLNAQMKTAEFDENEPYEEQMDGDERRRLLYVGATRARDHLVVSVHRKLKATKSAASEDSTATSAELLHEAGWNPETVEMLDLSGELVPVRNDTHISEILGLPALPTLAQWRAVHQDALEAAARPVAVSATRLAAEEAARREADEAARRTAARDPGLAKSPRDIDLPPWQKGRYGTAIGRAVHGVLQAIDLSTGAGISAACAAQAAAEGVLGKENHIEALCQSALRSDTVRRAATGRFWREVYVGVPHGDRVLEGYIDLLYEEAEELVIVDYKTDGWRTEADLDTKVERYRVQLRAYADAVRQAVGREVVRAELLFLGREVAVVRRVDV